MLQRLRQAGLVWPTLATLAGLAVLIGLGTWQLERKRWKENLLARIAAGVKADPVPLSPARKEMLGSDAQTLLTVEPEIEYRHVSAHGRFHHDKEQYLYGQDMLVARPSIGENLPLL